MAFAFKNTMVHGDLIQSHELRIEALENALGNTNTNNIVGLTNPLTANLNANGFNVNNLSEVLGFGTPATSAVATIDLSNANPSDGELIVLTDGQGGGQGQVIVLNFKPSPSASNEFNLIPGSHFLVDVINAWSGAVTATYDSGTHVVTLTCDVAGQNGASIGNTLSGVTYVDFSGGTNSVTSLQISSDLSLSSKNISNVGNLSANAISSDESVTTPYIVLNSIYSNGGDPSIEFDSSNGYLKDDGTLSMSWNYFGVTVPNLINVGDGQGNGIINISQGNINLGDGTLSITAEGQFSIGGSYGTSKITATDFGPTYLGDPASGILFLDQVSNQLVWNNGLLLKGQSLCMNDASGSGGATLYMDGGNISTINNIDNINSITNINRFSFQIQTITVADDASTLSEDKSLYFLALQDGDDPSIFVTMPAAANMTGRELTFVNTNHSYESYMTLQGTDMHDYGGGQMYMLSGYGTVKFISDGTEWFVLSEKF